MAMIVHTGVPGAGKTYLLVKTFTSMFCEYDKETQRFQLKPEHQDKSLVSNIQGLALEHLDIDVMMSDRCMAMAKARWYDNPKSKDLDEMEDVIDEFYAEFYEEKVRWFFDHAHQQALCEKHGPLIYLIEESQRYFDSKELGRQKWVRDVLYFFERHRHMGFSILCDTQHISKIHKGIAVLFEMEVQAKPRTLSLAGEFKYNEISDGVKTNQFPIVVKPDQRIFKTYKSMTHKEQVRPKKPLIKIVLFVVVVFGFGAFMLNYAINHLGPDDVIAAEDHTQGVTDPAAPRATNASQGKRALGSSTIEIEPVWVRLSYVMFGDNQINVIHPVHNTIIPLLEMDLPVKRTGDGIFADISGAETVIH
jgi:hypothetical protein